MLDSLREKSNMDKVIMDDLLGKPRQGVILSNVGYFQQKKKLMGTMSGISYLPNL